MKNQILKNQIVVNVLSFIGAYLVATPALYLAVDWVLDYGITSESMAKAFATGLGLGVGRIIYEGIKALWRRIFKKRRNSHA